MTSSQPGSVSSPPLATAAPLPTVARWAKVVDHERCIGCHACTTACKSENQVPVGVTRTYVKYVDVGVFPQVRRAFQVTRCNQCDDAPCTVACPTTAMFRRPDGIVDFDKAACIGCKACIAACPYDAIFINPEDHSAEKCNFCAHRLDVGLEPACVVVCPTEAILVGDLEDPNSRVAQIVHREPVAVRRPEKETRPKLFYRGAHQATLDPLAARRPSGGLFLWGEQLAGGEHVVSGHPAPANSSAAAVLAYDVPHSAPWDWRVSLYTLTKGIAAGVYLVAVLLLALGRTTTASPLWLFGVPILGGLFLGVTGGLLIWDLEHPERFWFLFTRPQWRSWLVRGAFVIGGYSAVLALHFAAALAGRPALTRALMVPGLPLALLSAVYTAYLFAQAKARDLWQNPLLPPHLAVQAALAGAAALTPVAMVEQPALTAPLLGVLAVASVLHILFVLGEHTMTHGTAHAHLAAREMTVGRFRGWFWAGMMLAAFGAAAAWIGAAASGAAASWIGPAADVAASWIGPAAAASAVLGLLSFEHAYVQAGQSVPLA
jgi:Fe-S-cluster-containing dehydrogenase component/formate-dependent nitrite reductase membrane component NrfD